MGPQAERGRIQPVPHDIGDGPGHRCAAGLRGEQQAARRGELRIDVLLGEEERLAMLRAEARRGLTAAAKQLPPKWFYDERGSALFEQPITAHSDMFT